MTTTLNPLIVTEDAPHPFHWTVEAYYRAWEAGVFGPDACLELIQGRIVEQMPPSPLDTSLSNIIADVLRSVLSALTVRVEGSVHFDFDGEPIPDVSAVTGANRDYWVVVPEQKQIIVHREPAAEGYVSVTRLSENEAISPLAAPEVILPVRELLGR